MRRGKMGVNKFLKTGSIVYLIFAVIQIIPAVQEFKYANAAGVQSQSTAHMISMYCCLISMAVGILLGVCGLTGKALGLCKIIDTVFIAAAVLSFLQGIVLNSFGTLV